MNTLKTLFALTAFTTLTIVIAPLAHGNESSCSPRIVTTPTGFPAGAQDRRESGVVRLGVQLDSHGKVANARIVKSSSSSVLDHSALKSALTTWRFDVTNCTTDEIAQERVIVVTFQRPPGLTVSGTLNRKAIARTRHLLADERCVASATGSDATVFTCLSAESGLANARR